MLLKIDLENARGSSNGSFDQSFGAEHLLEEIEIVKEAVLTCGTDKLRVERDESDELG